MQRKTQLVIFLFVLVVVLHFVANALGVYDTQISAGNVWFDNILHILVGIASALFWVMITEKYQRPFASLVISGIAFVLVLATTWELFELSLYLFMTDYVVQLKIYSPSVGEAIEDIFSNLLGGALFLFLQYTRKTIPSRPNYNIEKQNES